MTRIPEIFFEKYLEEFAAKYGKVENIRIEKRRMKHDQRRKMLVCLDGDQFLREFMLDQMDEAKGFLRGYEMGKLVWGNWYHYK